MAHPLAVTLIDGVTATTSLAGDSVDGSLDEDGTADVYTRSAGALTLEVTAASGTDPTLDVFVETSPSGSSWQAVGAFTQRTGVGWQELRVAGLRRYVRASYSIGGTDPSFTFSLSGDLEICLADPVDFDALGLPDELIAGVDPSVIATQLLAATDQVLGYVNAAYSLPLTSWSYDLRRYVAVIAAYKSISSHIGYRPESFDEELRRQYERLVGSEQSSQTPVLELIAAGRIPVVGAVDKTPETVEAAGYVTSAKANRGW